MSRERLNQYEKAERTLGTQFFNQFYDKIDCYQFTPPNSRKGYDGTYKAINADSSTFFEIKVRNIKMDSYPDYILQADKANALSKWHNQGYELKYINFFINDSGTYDAIVFDLNYRIEQWRKMGMENVLQDMWMNNATYISNDKVSKKVIMLKYDPMIDTKITNTSWSLN